MTFALAFNDLTAAAPRQRARCCRTGRFVAWSKVPQLRVPGAPRIIVIPAPVVDVAEVVEVAQVAPVSEVAPVAVVDGAEVEAAPLVVGGLFSIARTRSARVGAAAAALVDGARSTVAAAGRWFRRKASSLLAGARAALVAGALAVADGAPPVGDAALVGAPPVEVGM